MINEIFILVYNAYPIFLLIQKIDIKKELEL